MLAEEYLRRWTAILCCRACGLRGKPHDALGMSDRPSIAVSRGMVVFHPPVSNNTSETKRKVVLSCCRIQSLTCSHPVLRWCGAHPVPIVCGAEMSYASRGRTFLVCRPLLPLITRTRMMARRPPVSSRIAGR